MSINTTLVANTIQPLYSKKLLDHAVQETRLVEFAQQQELPANSGATSIRFFRPPAADLTQSGAPATLTEGTAPTTYRDFAFTAIDAALVQLGQVAKVTDIANNVGLIKYLDTAIQLMGEEFALDVDTRLRNILVHQTTGLSKRYAQGLANFGAVAAATLANSCVTPRDFLDAKTQLVINRTPKINGKFVAVTPPQVIRDMLNNTAWLQLIQQQNADKAFMGEVGEYSNIKIIEATNPFTEDETEGTFASTFSGAGTNTTGFIYSTIITGKGAYGTVNMKKMGGSMDKPQIIINDKPDKSDPLGQYILVGWKAFWTGLLLNSAWGVTLRSKSQFV